MKIDIPTTSYWHKLSNDEKREILNNKIDPVWFAQITQNYLLLKPFDSKGLAFQQTRFLEKIEECSKEYKFQHEQQAKAEKREELRKQLLADYGVSDV